MIIQILPGNYKDRQQKMATKGLKSENKNVVNLVQSVTSIGSLQIQYPGVRDTPYI